MNSGPSPQPLLPVAEALAAVLKLADRLTAETVPLRHASGRVLAEPVRAARDQPPFDASAMDGYAICDADHRPGARLRVIGEAAAGRAFGNATGPGQAVRISTGAPIPNGAARVVIQEDVRVEGGDIILGARLNPETHIRPQGQDFRSGFALDAGRRLRPADLALLAAMNAGRLRVSRRPVVAFLSTGDELVEPGQVPGPDQIIASNSVALAAMAEAEGALARILPIARDTEASLRFAFGLAEGADLLVTSGGASVGQHDLVGRIAAELGLQRAFYKIAMRPGKPLMAGRLGTMAMLGLPGNPVSAMVCGHVFLLPMLRAMQGMTRTDAPRIRARLAEPMPPNGPRTHYMRARLVADLSGGLSAIAPLPRQDSALLATLAGADALLIRPANDPHQPAGATVEFIAI